MSANERQVAGSHYRRKFQHWDLMALADAGYFAGQVTKYSERHSKKNGREDLEKALHFAEKMNEVRKSTPTRALPVHRKGFLGKKVRVEEAPRVRVPDDPAVLNAVRDYAVEAGLTALQERIFEYCLLRPDRTEDIVSLCKKHLEREYPTVQTTQEVEQKPASIPAFLFSGDDPHLSPAQRLMKSEMLARYEKGPGTPEDGGHHKLDPDLEAQVQEDFSNEALARVLEESRGSEGAKS